VHFCARACSEFSPFTYAHRDALAIHVTALFGAQSEEIPIQASTDWCVNTYKFSEIAINNIKNYNKKKNKKIQEIRKICLQTTFS